MGIAKDEIAAANRGEGCLGRADPDEPVFIIQGSDAFGAALVGQWCELAGSVLGHNHPRVQNARVLQAQMTAWPRKKIPGYKP